VTVTLLLSDHDVRALCNIGDMVNALDLALLKEAKGPGVVLPERVNIAHNDVFLRVMPALLPEAGLMGLKFFHGSMAKGVRYVVAVCSLETGAVLALVDAAYLTAARTGSTSGVATRWMSREDSHLVGVIGSGLEAETNLEAVCAVRGITDVKVFSRSAARREEFAARMAAKLGVRIVACSSPEDAVAGTDIVVVATNTGPEGVIAYRGAWLAPGQHVVSIGSTTPVLREIDEQTFLGADRVVFDAEFMQVSHESGDVAAVLRCQPGWGASVGLSEILTGATPGRSSPADITLFKSVGTAAQDLIGANYIIGEAARRGVGNTVADIGSPKTF
jgi:ornithine cyclodeaminase/alanine dehydrogenase-like protein (mu-crystallin family)